MSHKQFENDNEQSLCDQCNNDNDKNKPVNVLGIIAFIISLLSAWLGVYFCITPIIGLVLSAVAVKLRKRYSLNGLAIAALVISILSLICWIVIWFILGSILIGISQ